MFSTNMRVRVSLKSFVFQLFFLQSASHAYFSLLAMIFRHLERAMYVCLARNGSSGVNAECYPPPDLSAPFDFSLLECASVRALFLACTRGKDHVLRRKMMKAVKHASTMLPSKLIQDRKVKLPCGHAHTFHPHRGSEVRVFAVTNNYYSVAVSTVQFQSICLHLVILLIGLICHILEN